MATQRSLDEAYMACARAIAALSHAVRKKVGAILVSPQGIIAEGYNGTPSKFENVCELIKSERHYTTYNESRIQWYCRECAKYFDSTHVTIELDGNENKRYHSSIELITKPEVLHAESNAIAKVAKSTNSSLGATLYVTCSPCYECSKMIIQAGIKRVVYDEEYRLLDGIDLLRKANIEVVKL